MDYYPLKKSKKSDEIWLLSYADLITNLLIFFIAMFSMADLSRARMERIEEVLTGKQSATSLKSIKEEIAKKIDQKGLKDLVKVDMGDNGVEISLNSGIVFPVGSDAIEARWIPVLDDLLTQIAPYAGRYEFAVEGHTDSTPIKGGGKFQNNWDLASARAHQIRQQLESHGISPSRLREESYGETRRLPDSELNGLSEDEIKSKHRRVVIRIF
jgi:chemotaxis protein MotB